MNSALRSQSKIQNLKSKIGQSLCVAFVLLTLTALRAEDSGAMPSFPNYARIVPVPNYDESAPRANPVGPVDPELPFSWPQFIVVRENGTFLRFVDGFDPGLQPVQIEFLPNSPTNLKILDFNAQSGVAAITTLPKTGGTIEVLPFKVRARELISSETFNLTYDIRLQTARVRGTPLLSRSPGDIIKPGQIVRYTWTQTGRGEKRPKCEAEFVGKTGIARGLTKSTITEVLAVKMQPFALGHYLLTVTPRDVRGEPARGSTSNGQVFRCAFGSENLPPTVDGFTSDSFTPAAGQAITLTPIAVDPETGKSTFSGANFDFGDGITAVSSVAFSQSHAYTKPGIYRARCTVADDQGLRATAEDNIVVGGTAPTKFTMNVLKQIIPEEAGIGALQEDTLNATFKGISAAAGDRIIFAYNRNLFGRLNATDPSDDTDIILKGNSFSGPTRRAKNFTVTSGADSITVTVGRGQFDRTGDPRFGRAELKGIFKNQRIAVCVIPADGSTPKVSVYTGNMQIKVTGGETNRLQFIPEEFLKATATTKEPDPRKQEIP